jgi:hypothetical protein
MDNKYNEFYTKPDDAFVYYVDIELLEESIERIRANQLILDEEYEEDDLRGTLKTDNDNQTILTSIAYDEGWNVYVDGKRVDVKEACGALLSFNIEEAGNHEIRLVYRSSAFKIGMVITLIGLPLSYLWSVLNWIVNDNLGILEKKVEKNKSLNLEGLSDYEKEIVEIIVSGASTQNLIEEKISFGAERLTALLGMMEIKGIIRKKSDKSYIVNGGKC